MKYPLITIVLPPGVTSDSIKVDIRPLKEKDCDLTSRVPFDIGESILAENQMEYNSHIGYQEENVIVRVIGTETIPTEDQPRVE